MTRRTALILFTTFLPSVLAAETQTITVNLYDMAGVPEGILAQAVTLATQIYAETGVSLKWVPQAPPVWQPGLGISFRPNSSPAEVSLRLVPRAISDRIVRRGSSKLGLAYDAGQNNYRFFATVFYDRVENAAPKLYDVSVPDLLGHVLTHELGHLLLGPDAHARGTIMACPFDTAEFLFLRRGQLRFNKKQAAQLRSLTASRINAAKSQIPKPQAALAVVPPSHDARVPEPQQVSRKAPAPAR